MHREIKFKLPNNTKKAYFNMHTIGNRFITKEMNKKGDFWVFVINNDENYLEYNIHYELTSGKVLFYRNFSLFDNDELKLKETKDSFRIIHFSKKPYNLARVRIKEKSFIFIKIFTILETLESLEVQTSSNKQTINFSKNNLIVLFHEITDNDGGIKFIFTNKSGKKFFFTEEENFSDKECEIKIAGLEDFEILNKENKLGYIANWFGDLNYPEHVDEIFLSSIFKSSSLEGYEWLSLLDYSFKGKKIKNLSKFLDRDKKYILDIPLNHCSYKSIVYKKNKDWYAGTNYMANNQIPEIDLNSKSYREYVREAIEKLNSAHPNLSFRIDSAPKISDDFILWLQKTFPNNKFYYESWGSPRQNLKDLVYEQDNSFIEYIREYFQGEKGKLNYKKFANYINKFFLYKTLKGNLFTLYSLSNQDFKAFSEVEGQKVNELMHMFLPFMGGKSFIEVRDYKFLDKSLFNHINNILLDLDQKDIKLFFPIFYGDENKIILNLKTPHNSFLYAISSIDLELNGNEVAKGSFFKVSSIL